MWIVFEFEGQELHLVQRWYSNDRPAIQVVTEDGEPYATLTVNIPEHPWSQGEYFIKTWSENAELANFLRTSGIFVDTGFRVPTGFVHAEIWKLKE